MSVMSHQCISFIMSNAWPDVRFVGLIKQTCSVDATKYYFTNRVVNVWNSLPSHIVSSPTLSSFKSRLGKHDFSVLLVWFVTDYCVACGFYRAMHFSAKRSIAIACRLSVTLVDCDHIGWNSLKIISPLVSHVHSLQPQHAAEWLQIVQRSQWRVYRKLPLLF